MAVTELEKLKEYLDENGYVSVYNDIFGKDDQIIVFDKENLDIRLWDAVCHRNSYGYNRGLLEIYGCLCNDVIGWLTAEDVIKILKNYEKTGEIIDVLPDDDEEEE